MLYADVAGYSRLTGSDEEGTHRRLSASLDFIAQTVDGRGGRVIHYAGDAVLAEFASVIVAVECAVEIQKGLAQRNAGMAASNRLLYRIGINSGDVIVDREDIYGDGVNIAARLEGLAEAGGICVSAKVRDEIGNKLELDFEDLGQQDFKNIAEPVHAFHVVPGGRSVAEKVAAKVRKEFAGPPVPVATKRRRGIVRLCQMMAAVWLVLLVLDLTTGEPFWVHWPGLVLATLAGLLALPLWVGPGFALLFARGAVLVAAMVLINAFSWWGEAWAQWPALGLAAIGLVYWAGFLRK